jgi:glycine betaine catabolism B
MKSQEYTVRILGVKQETLEVKTYLLEKPNNYVFIAGQYCMVGLIDNPDIGKRRIPLTFSNTPMDDHLEITIKKMGIFTSTLYDYTEGGCISISEPRGNTYNITEATPLHLGFIAGGSGITPFMSAIRFVTRKKIPAQVYLFYSNNTQKDTLFKEELITITKEHPNIQVIFTLTREIVHEQRWEEGYINEVMIKKYVDNPQEIVWYICGPPSMNSAMKNVMTTLNIPDDHIKLEKWELPGKSDIQKK